MSSQLPIRDALLSFAAGQPLRAALFLTYSFDGRWFEEAIVPGLCERPIATMLVIRDRNAILSEAPSLRYRKANASYSAVFHPKLALLISEDSARAVIGSANLTRGGFERQKELGRVFDLGPTATADAGIFDTLVEYLAHGVAREVCGDTARDLVEVADALREIVTLHGPYDSITPHAILHNYEGSIWTQLRASLPHRVLRRAAIVSPFFEPDRTKPEDPAVGAEDSSIFQRLLVDDFSFEPAKNERPVRIFFRQSEGRTQLPVRKLADSHTRVRFFAQDETERPLHAKLLLLEGAEGPKREPFLVAVSGSPNFTTAGFVKHPPYGNAELAVVTELPAKGRALEQSIRALDLEKGFTELPDLGGLTSERDGEPPTICAQGAADVTYRVADGLVTIAFLQPIPVGARVRVLVQRDGAWVVAGEASASSGTNLTVSVERLAMLEDGSKLLAIRSTTVRVDVIGADDTILISSVLPLNVDTPADFCGQTLVGPLLLTLDERIARAGLGVPLTYREQQKWIEAQRQEQAGNRATKIVGHQADLDRFYRNVSQGLRGIAARTQSGCSLFSLRRALDEVCRWAVEATTADTDSITRECRLFLVDRLLRITEESLERNGDAYSAALQAIAAELRLVDRIRAVLEWIERVEDRAVAGYIGPSRKCAKRLIAAFGAEVRA